MYRRALLTGTAGAAVTSLTGCLDRLDTRSVWNAPPRIRNPPEAVYLPSTIEGMRRYGITEVDDVAVGLFGTVPHRFWLVTGDRRERVDLQDDDSLHLMASVWDPATGLVPPAEVELELYHEGEESGRSVQLWPMLAQRMGFHYGDNVQLPGAGEYEATIRVTPTSADLTGEVAGRFDQPIETTMAFSVDPDSIYDLDVLTLDQRHWGQPGALPLMIDRPDLSSAIDAVGSGRQGAQSTGRRSHTASSSMDEDQDDRINGPLPLQVPTTSDLPGRSFDGGSTGDAHIVLTRTAESPASGESGPYLAVSPRTPYNRLGLPFMAISVAQEPDSDADDRTPLTERLDDRFGHHYGAPLDVQPGEGLTLQIDSPPQLTRHGGYETAFFDMDDVTVTLPA
jgi:hypothetical protein